VLEKELEPTHDVRWHIAAHELVPRLQPANGARVARARAEIGKHREVGDMSHGVGSGKVRQLPVLTAPRLGA
jgi:hypothetical protein